MIAACGLREATAPPRDTHHPALECTASIITRIYRVGRPHLGAAIGIVYSNYNFEIIGYGEPEWVRKKIAQFNNISLVGKVVPADLHSYVSRWKVGIIPFVQSGLSDAVDPIKIYEYLYFGLPVVVTGIGHLKDYPKTYFATKSNIREKIAQAIADATSIDDLEDFLRKTTWEARFDSLLGLASSRKSLFTLYKN